MKRQGSRQPTLEAYFSKRSRIPTDDDRENDENVIVATGMTALQMIADAYADAEEEQDNREQPAPVYANPVDVAHDHD
ncbi:hypothetical protein AAVH_07662 [Aphelenchoides avenae]|nr:hypothetical protein AAVH_07662 [Aphelenchus avenae]